MVERLLGALLILLVPVIAFAEKPKVVPNFGRGVFGVYADAALNNRVHGLLVEAHRSAPWVMQSDSVLFNVYIQTEPNSGLPIMPSSTNVQLLAVGVDQTSASLQHVYQGDFVYSVPVHDSARSLRVWVSVGSNSNYEFQHMALNAAEKKDVALRKGYDNVIGSNQPKSGHTQVLRAMDPRIRVAPRLNPAGTNPIQSATPGATFVLGPAIGQSELDRITDILGEFANQAYQGVGSGVVVGDDSKPDFNVPESVPTVPDVQTPHGAPTVYVDEGADGTVDWGGPVELGPDDGSGGGSTVPDLHEKTMERR